MNIKKKNKNGYAILELLFYLSFFAVLSLLVINSMITMAQSFRETSIQNEFIQSGSIIERITREIRHAYDLTLVSATDLQLNTTDDEGENKTIEFLFSGSNINFLENDVLTGNLNTPNIVVTGLVFTSIDTTVGKAIKINLSLRSSNDKLNRVQDFYDTITLRGSYAN